MWLTCLQNHWTQRQRYGDDSGYQAYEQTGEVDGAAFDVHLNIIRTLGCVVPPQQDCKVCHRMEYSFQALYDLLFTTAMVRHPHVFGMNLTPDQFP